MASRALLLFGGWNLGLVATVVAYRLVRILGGSRINAWGRGTVNEKDAPIAKRIHDAHQNTVENLVLFAAIVLVAHIQGRVSAIDHVASYVPVLRVLQSLAHISGGGQLNVLVRATFFSGQLAAFGTMIYLLL
jgi:uncharacterized MAPEG superfamily protein